MEEAWEEDSNDVKKIIMSEQVSSTTICSSCEQANAIGSAMVEGLKKTYNYSPDLCYGCQVGGYLHDDDDENDDDADVDDHTLANTHKGKKKYTIILLRSVQLIIVINYYY